MKKVQGLDIRPSPIAGTWYESNPEKLARNIDSYLEIPTPLLGRGQVYGVIVPHAGHIYSGAVAGYAFAELLGLQFDKVVVLSPMHKPTPFPFITTTHDYYQTPLGNITVDKDSLGKISTRLEELTGIQIKAVPHDSEHALEIELPFLQRCLKGSFNLIPLMIRDYDILHLKAVGEILADHLKNSKSVIVASSDLSHFYSDSVARKLDTNILSAISTYSPENVMRVVTEGDGEACGLGAIITAMVATKNMGANAVEILNYQNSSSVTGDKSSVVGYGSAVIFEQN